MASIKNNNATINNNNNTKLEINHHQNGVALEPKEIRIKVPYGHIAAKVWGSPSGRPVLAVHGWLDNAGTFDLLIPHMLQAHNLYIVAFDEPGLGLSSHKPPGSEYGRWSVLKEMKRVIDHMKWDRVTLLGHSQGAHYSFLFAAAYPNLVERLIVIDIFKPITHLGKRSADVGSPYMGDTWADNLANCIQTHLKVEDQYTNNEDLVPAYSEDCALRKLMEAYKDSVTEDAARILMIRGTKRTNRGLIFTRDIRLRLSDIEPSPSEERMLNLMKRLTADLLIIRVNQTPYLVPDEIREQYYDVYRKNCKIFKDVSLDGTHHIHLVEPKKVAPYINEFLEASLNRKCDLPPRNNL